MNDLLGLSSFCIGDTLTNRCSSNLVEGGDVNRLHVVLEGLNCLLEVVSADLGVLDNATNHNLVHTVGDGLLLILSLPEETVHGDGDDLFGEGVEIGLSFVGLDLPDDERLGNRAGLWFCGLGGLLLLGLLLGLLLLSLLIGRPLLGLLIGRPLLCLLIGLLLGLLIGRLLLGLFLLIFNELILFKSLSSLIPPVCELNFNSESATFSH